MNHDDETLMAYADGELDAARRAEIARDIERDPELARRVARLAAVRTDIAGAYSGVLDQPVPDRLLAAARGAQSATPATRGNVVQFPARSTRPPPARWRAREWTAMAASLVLGIFIANKLLPAGGDIDTKRKTLVARGELSTALDTQLASTQVPADAVHIGLTFRNSQGAWCRSFVSSSLSTAGLACRHEGDWRIEQTNAVEIGGGDLRQAAASLPPALVNAIEARITGEALDADAEKAARDAGWK